MKTLPVWLFLAACSGGGSEALSGPCKDMCSSLVEDCAYAAYPSFDSCASGCLYTADEGADVTSEAQCIADAACDTFAIVECQNAYGN